MTGEDKRIRQRGVMLTTEAFAILENAIALWWEREGNTGRQNKEVIAAKLNMSVSSLRRIYRHEAVDRIILETAFKRLDLAWKEIYCFVAPDTMAERLRLRSQFQGICPSQPGARDAAFGAGAPLLFVPSSEDTIKAQILYALQDYRRPTCLEDEGLIRYLTKEGRLVEMRDWLKTKLQREDLVSKMARPYALKALIRWCITTRDFGCAERALDEARQLFASISNARAELASCLGLEAYLAWQINDYARSLRCHQEALDLWRTLDHRWEIAATLRSLSDDYTRMGQYAQARSHVVQALPLHQELGDIQMIALDYSTLGCLAAREGDYPQARAFHEQAMETARKGQDRGMVAYLGFQVTLDALKYRDFAIAQETIHRSLAYYVEIKHLTQIESVLAHAIRWEAESSAAYMTDRLEPRRARRIARLWGVRLELRVHTRIEVPYKNECPRLRDALDNARAVLSEEGFSELEQQGGEMTWEEMARYILDRRCY